MQEKRKKFWIIFVISIVSVLSLSFLFGVLTNLKTVSVEFKERLAVNSRLEQNILEKIEKDGEFEYGKGLMFVNVQKSVDLIEKKNPFVKVHQVVTKFPNALSIYIVEREPCFYTKTDGYYLIFDKEFKVLDKFESNENGNEKFENEYLKYTAEIDYHFEISQLSTGDFVEESEGLSVYKQIYAGVYGSFESIISVKSIKIENNSVYITMKEDLTNYADGVVILFEELNDITIKTWVGMEAFKIIDEMKNINMLKIIKDPTSQTGYYAQPINNN